MSNGRRPQLPDSWLRVLEPEFHKPYMANLRAFLVEEKQKGPVYPPGRDIFRAFWLTPFDQVRVVILGQDPYIFPRQAHGLCFSVQRGVKPPPSLVNIFQELQSDLGITPPSHGDLTTWAEQGILLLNTALTVRHRQVGSHRGKGWETFTDRVITELNTQKEGLVFVLWGSAAKKKSAMVDRQRHLILTASHPSPRSADYGFFGSRHFSRINEHLQGRGESPIDWSLPS
ncbi:MAG: uracil-DNA glycosylase [Myxococcota bacterium]